MHKLHSFISYISLNYAKDRYIKVGTGLHPGINLNTRSLSLMASRTDQLSAAALSTLEPWVLGPQSTAQLSKRSRFSNQSTLLYNTLSTKLFLKRETENCRGRVGGNTILLCSARHSTSSFLIATSFQPIQVASVGYTSSLS